MLQVLHVSMRLFRSFCFGRRCLSFSKYLLRSKCLAVSSKKMLLDLWM